MDTAGNPRGLPMLPHPMMRAEKVPLITLWKAYEYFDDVAPTPDSLLAAASMQLEMGLNDNTSPAATIQHFDRADGLAREAIKFDRIPLSTYVGATLLPAYRVVFEARKQKLPGILTDQRCIPREGVLAASDMVSRIVAADSLEQSIDDNSGRSVYATDFLECMHLDDVLSVHLMGIRAGLMMMPGSKREQTADKRPIPNLGHSVYAFERGFKVPFILDSGDKPDKDDARMGIVRTSFTQLAENVIDYVEPVALRVNLFGRVVDARMAESPEGAMFVDDVATWLRADAMELYVSAQAQAVLTASNRMMRELVYLKRERVAAGVATYQATRQ